MSRKGHSIALHPATELGAKLRDKSVPLRERAALAAETQEQHDLGKMRFKVLNAAQKTIGVSKDEIEWTDTLYLLARDHPHNDEPIWASDWQAFEYEGLLFTLDQGADLAVVQVCGECGHEWRLLRANNLPQLGKAIRIYEESTYSCRKCVMKEAAAETDQ